MMAETIDDITINYSEDNQLIVKELEKVVLTRGAWSTIVFKFVEWSDKTEAYGPTKYTIRRYQKRNGEFSQRSKFNLSNSGQAKQLAEILNKWVDEESGESE